MKRVFLAAILVVFYLCSSSSFYSPTTYAINVTITKIRNKNGKIQIQVYRDQATFAKETPYKIYRFNKSEVINGKLNLSIQNIPKGTYGLALLDDENNNKEMDYGLFLPDEGFAFSDYYHTGWSKPVFDDFKFDLDSDKNVSMIVRYL